MGEFPVGDQVLYIPNTPPNKYRWFGGVEFDRERQMWSSPNLAFYWHSGRAADGNVQGWPRYSEDLVLFSLQFSKLALRTDVSDLIDERLQLVPFSVDLPYAAPPGLQPYRVNSRISAPPHKWTVYFLNPDSKTELVYCPSVESYNRLVALRIAEKKEHPGAFRGEPVERGGHCSGSFYARPGLRVDYTIDALQLPHWREVQAATTNLIASWERPNADATTAERP